MARTHFRRYGRSAYRKGKRLYKWGRQNPQKALAMARSAISGVRYIRGLVNSEMFHNDQDLVLGSAQNVILPIHKIGTDDTVSGRTGNSVLAKSLTLNGYMYINSSVVSNTRVMIALVLDKQQISDTSPTIGTIFQDATSAHTLLNRDNLGRFSILMRKQYVLTPATGGGRDAINLSFFKRLGFHFRYNGTADTDIQKNGLYLVIVTSENTNYPTVVFKSRLNYHDN